MGAAVAPWVAIVAACVQLIVLAVYAGKWAGRTEAARTDEPRRREDRDDRAGELARRIEYLEQARVTREQFIEAMQRLDKRLDKMGEDASRWNSTLQAQVGRMSTDLKLLKHEHERFEKEFSARGWQMRSGEGT